MSAARDGFTLAELLVVVVLSGVTLGAVYQTLMVQEKTYQAGGAIIQDQDALRTGLGILETELREVSTIGTGIGEPDIRVASSDSVVFRAQRKIAYACDLHANDKWLVVAAQGDLFAAGDSILLFMDGDSLRSQDDRWDRAVVNSVGSATNADCSARFPEASVQLLRLTSGNLSDLRRWAPLRSFEWLTYGIYDFGGAEGWGLGRHGPGESPRYLVGGLAPRGEGLVFQYYDAAETPTTAVDEIASIRIDLATDPTPQGAAPARMETQLFLRNN